MLPILSSSQPLTMSSKEIADLTGKEHFNVLRDIRAMLPALGQDALSFEGMSSDAYGRPLRILNLPKDLTITLVAGYNVSMRHRIVTRWIELEGAPAVAPALPNSANPAEAARA
jgi:phage regulator Rha-like protein